MKKRQLRINLENVEIPVFHNVLKGDYRYRTLPNMPMLYWPSGLPCIEANLYIMKGIITKSWSLKGKGGTAKANADLLPHIIRFCFENNIHFSELNDAYFEFFINGLMAEKHNKGKKVGRKRRSNTRVGQIGRQTLAFLVDIGKRLSDKSFIGESGCRLTVAECEYKEYGKTVTYYNHVCIPTKDEYKKRLPVAISDVKKLMAFISAGENKNLVERNKSLVKAYKATGGRRTEVANLRVSDVEKALASEEKIPLLRLITLKQKEHALEQDKEERFVPVYRTTLKSIAKYIKRNRSRVLKKVNNSLKEKGISPLVDHGFVFIGENSGLPLGPDTITTYFNGWAKDIGATGSLMAHAFRHSFITDKIEMLIELFNLQDEGEFKAKFAVEKAFKDKVMAWTGHKHEKSLSPYIHLAFSELSGVNKAMDAAQVVYGVSSAKDEVKELKDKILSGQISGAELMDDVGHILDDIYELLDGKAKGG
ncbi:tyrosine-type recombinase/integrase [Aliiglaciecola sp. SL4]|uniref:tyrosine-type recombinase/integrase n=1 Tax=Aliiglaciecola sp. SL4 TaxID=3239806 RepID=UPI00355C66AB